MTGRPRGAAVVSTVATGGAAGAAAGGWRPSRGAALLLLTASGFAGLGYQIIWVQQTAVWLGHETAALLAVIGAFFGGLSLGAWAIGPRIERGARPGRAYAACEAIIAGWSLVLAVAIGPAGELLMALTGAQAMPLRQWGVAFGGTFLLLLPATAAMGATLPAMARVLAGDRDRIGPIGALYAANTAGAVLGVLVTTFWLVPQAGLARTALACAAVNALCAVAALAWFDRPAASAGVAVPRSSPGPGDRTVRVRLAATGLLGIGYEVLVVRVLAQVTENTVYTYALLLAAYLVGTALGAAAWQRWAAEAGTHPRRASRLLQALAACCLGGTLALWSVDVLHATLVRIMGGGFGAAIAAEAGIALVVFLPATVVMGALFSELSAQAHAAGVGLGRALGINTLGAAFAPLLFGVVLLPWAGPKLALLAVAAGYLLTSMQARRLAPSAWGLAGAAAALAWWAPPLVFVDLPDGAHLVAYRDGAGASVSVVEDAGGTRVLRINNREQEGSNATRFSDGRQALLPLWLHEMPRSALFLGLGTGVTASVAAIDDRVAVDVVELLPEVVEASRHFADEGEPRGLPRVMVADARRFVRSAPRSYDVIVSDNFHPARSGAASLYTVEHFAAVRERLAPGGLFCQWLPLHQLDLATLRSIVRSFLAAFPDGRALLATYSLETPVLGLIATPDGTGFDLARLRQRLSSASTTSGRCSAPSLRDRANWPRSPSRHR